MHGHGAPRALAAWLDAGINGVARMAYTHFNDPLARDVDDATFDQLSPAARDAILAQLDPSANLQSMDCEIRDCPDGVRRAAGVVEISVGVRQPRAHGYMLAWRED